MDLGALVDGTEVGPGRLPEREMEEACLHLALAREARAHAHGTAVAHAGHPREVAVARVVLEVGGKAVRLEVVAPDPAGLGLVALGGPPLDGPDRDGSRPGLPLVDGHDLRGARGVRGDEATGRDARNLGLAAHPGDVAAGQPSPPGIVGLGGELLAVADEQGGRHGTHDDGRDRRSRGARGVRRHAGFEAQRRRGCGGESGNAGATPYLDHDGMHRDLAPRDGGPSPEDRGRDGPVQAEKPAAPRAFLPTRRLELDHVRLDQARKEGTCVESPMAVDHAERVMYATNAMSGRRHQRLAHAGPGR